MTSEGDSQPVKKGVSLGDLGYRPIVVELTNHLAIKLLYMTTEDEQFLSKLLDQEIAARDFVVEFLAHQLVEPEISQADVASWPDDILQRVAKEFAEAQPAGFGAPLPDGAETFEAFRSVARTHQDELFSSIRETLNAFTSSYSDRIKPLFGIADSLASSLNAAFDIVPSMYSVDLAATEIVRKPLAGFALSDLGSSVSLIANSTIDNLSKAMAGSFTVPMLEQLDAFSSTAAKAVSGLNEDLARAVASSIQPLDLSTLIPNLPDLTEAFRELAKARHGAAALDGAGFGYSLTLWEMQFLIKLSDIAEQDRPTVIFLELRTITEGQEFEKELQSLFADPSILAKRWPAVREGVEDHRRARYFSSVSVLLPQIEGVINDILTLADAVISVKSKFYERNADGTQGRQLKGLNSKSALAKNKANLNQDLAKFVTSSLVPERNGILHGVDAGYGQSERSVHLMLVLLSLALAVAELEDDLKKTTGVVPNGPV